MRFHPEACSQRQHRTLHIQKDVLHHALCCYCAALASIFRMESISTSYTLFTLSIPPLHQILGSMTDGLVLSDPSQYKYKVTLHPTPCP